LAEGLGADYAMSDIYELQKFQKEQDLTNTCVLETTRLLGVFGVHEDDTASQEVDKVQDITTILLRIPFYRVREDDMAS
jgi:hypothetical protein